VRLQLVESRLVASDELARIYNAFLNDIMRETFCGVTYPLIFCGKK